jgi:hypothetical protein
MRNSYKILVWKVGGKPFSRPKARWKDLKQTCCEDADWIKLILGLCPVIVFFEHGNELLGFIKCRFLDELSEYQWLKADSASWG